MSTAPTESGPQSFGPRPLGSLEKAAAGLLLVAALLVRLPQLFADFDRGLEGFQGAFFAIAAVNYERLGTSVGSGYPALIVELPAPIESTSLGPIDALVYANHPPTVPLLAWRSARLLGPSGWSEAWREDRAPEGLEPALRLPFFLLHMSALVLFWCLLREAAGATAGVIGLALLVTLPVGLLYANLINYENAALPCVLAATWAYLRLLRGGGRGAWFALGAAFLAAGAVTWAPIFFLPPLVLHALLRRRSALAAGVAIVGGGALALPLVLHSLWAPAGIGAGSALARARELWAPLLDGSQPFGLWVCEQLRQASAMLGTPVALLALLGVLLSFLSVLVPRVGARLSSGRVERSAGIVDLGVPLLAGALLHQLAFYRHTLEQQWSFWLYAAPGAAAAAAMLLACCARPILHLRAGIAPMVLLVSALLLPGIAQANRRLRELRAPKSELQDALALPRALGGELAPLVPRGAVGLLPEALGANLASSYYAWRNLYWTPELDAELPPWLAASSALADAPAVLLLPRHPPSAARPAVEALEVAATDRGLALEQQGEWRRIPLGER